MTATVSPPLKDLYEICFLLSWLLLSAMRPGRAAGRNERWRESQ